LPVFVFLLASSLLDTGAAAAQEAAAPRLSLEEAQGPCRDGEPSAAEARARAATAEATIAVRQAADRPVVALTGGYTRTNHVTEFVFPGPTGAPRVLIPTRRTTTTRDSPAVADSQRRQDGRALERAAQAEASAAAADVAAAQADLRLEVARAFWALVTARATAAVLDQSLARAQANVSDVRQRLNAGLVPPNEVASSGSAGVAAADALIETRNQRDLSAAELARLIGADLLQPIEPAATLDLAAPAAASLGGLRGGSRHARGAPRP
jgi:outer membrane protein TolC